MNLDGIEPIAPAGCENPSNDAMERVKLVLSNPTDREQPARLMFEKTAARAFANASARRSPESPPSCVIVMEIPPDPRATQQELAQRPERRRLFRHWFHGISQVRLPPADQAELELTLAYGHWGGVAAASHAQLCLIGWGSNQLWEQSALGSWGESICYEPDQVQAGMHHHRRAPVDGALAGAGAKRWGWTSNVGGGDFFRFFDPAGNRVPHAAMRTTYHRQGPCLTEVTYAGRIGARASSTPPRSASRAATTWCAASIAFAST